MRLISICRNLCCWEDDGAFVITKEGLILMRIEGIWDATSFACDMEALGFKVAAIDPEKKEVHLTPKETQVINKLKEHYLC